MQHISKWRSAAALTIAIPIAAELFLRSGTAQMLHGLRSLHAPQPDGLAVAVALSALSMLISGALWSRVLLCFGHRLPLRAGLSAFLGAGLAGYALSVVGPAAGCSMVLSRHGLNIQRATLVSIIANLLGFCGILLCAPMGLFLLAPSGASSEWAPLGSHDLVIGVVLLLALAVAVLAGLKALAALLSTDNGLVRRLLGQSAGLPRSSIRVRALVTLIPWSAASWLIGALALYALLHALSPAAAIDPATVIGASILANLLSSVAFFVPAGVGVRDGALVTLLSHATGLPLVDCAAAAVGVRALDLGTKASLLLALGASGALRLFRARRNSDTSPATDDRRAWGERAVHTLYGGVSPDPLPLHHRWSAPAAPGTPAGGVYGAGMLHNDDLFGRNEGVA